MFSAVEYGGSHFLGLFKMSSDSDVSIGEKVRAKLGGKKSKKQSTQDKIDKIEFEDDVIQVVKPYPSVWHYGSPLFRDKMRRSLDWKKF